MTIVCPTCNEVLGSVVSTARLSLSVHCPFDGHDFGVAVEPPAQAALPTEDAEKPTLGSA